MGDREGEVQGLRRDVDPGGRPAVATCAAARKSWVLALGARRVAELREAAAALADQRRMENETFGARAPGV